MTHITVRLVTDMSCGNIGQYQLNSNIGVFVFKYEAVTVAGLQKVVT